MRRLKDRIREKIVRILTDGLAGPQDLSTLVYRHAVKDSIDYVFANLRHASIFASREELWLHCIEVAGLKTKDSALILEFGVYKGYSANWFATQLPNSKVFGFDSFEGLPEAWVGESDYAKGTFSLSGRLPKVETNVSLVPGLFEESLPKFIETQRIDRIDLLHLDADIYSSTKTVLDGLRSLIHPGLIIVFDEYMMRTSWRHHEYRAWRDFVKENGVAYEYIGFSGSQAAIVVSQLSS